MSCALRVFLLSGVIYITVVLDTDLA
uniref:Uncharacterized protein LOC104220865 n=1 Tax=Nicotiana sylvestris TaxID=4096 RepID=A0A1U7W797_NICSY|nr:PREDICTED: uncharacterized protein LOC104220865 [Nicotiana sylvestris]